MMTSLAFPDRSILRVDLYPRVTIHRVSHCESVKIVDLDLDSPLPDFITSARRELMLSVVFFAFFGAIVAHYQSVW